MPRSRRWCGLTWPVPAAYLRGAFARQSRTALRRYLDLVHALGAELSISSSLAEVTPGLAALAEQAGDGSSHRADEPYRRALTGIYARLAATYMALSGEAPPRPRAIARRACTRWARVPRVPA